MNNREAQILARTFCDRLTVTRKKRSRNQAGETVFEDVVVYDAIPCAVSAAAGKPSDRKETHHEKDTSFVLFTMPGVELKDNDLVTAITGAGQTFRGRSGRTFAYISHGETNVRTEDAV